MKTWIKTSLVAVLATATLFSGAAMARGHGGGGSGWKHASPEQIKERADRRLEVNLARLELALALTPEQRPAWADFKKAAEARTDAMLKEKENRRNAVPPKTAIERLSQAEDFNKKRAVMLADMRKSVEVFYARLSPAQKTVFDAEAAHFMKPMHGGGRKKGGHGAGMGEPGCMMGGCDAGMHHGRCPQ